MKKRKTRRLRKGDVLEVVEYHDGRYGRPGERRAPKRKATKEDIQKVNDRNKTNLCWCRLVEYFRPGDIFVTLKYRPEERPETMQEALRDYRNFIQSMKRQYQKAGKELRWIRNIEKGTKDAWHIHMAINQIGNTESLIAKYWKHGSITLEKIKTGDEDLKHLAAYITKSENRIEKKKDGTPAKPRIRESNFRCSRNMPLPEPRRKTIIRWQREVKPKKGYYLSEYYEGINPKTGYQYRRYVMVRYRRLQP